MNRHRRLDGPHSGRVCPSPAAEAGFGNAGNITLTTDRLSLTGGGQISSSTWGLGHGGDINITANRINHHHRRGV